jgi:hypothetical protein
MKPPTPFTSSLMSDAKWRKVFRALAEQPESVFAATWKLTDEPEPIAGGLPDSEEVWESQVDGGLGSPVPYKKIEWLELLERVPYRRYDHAPVAYKAQDLGPVREALNALGRFPLQDVEGGFRIYGYHR